MTASSRRIPTAVSRPAIHRPQALLIAVTVTVEPGQKQPYSLTKNLPAPALMARLKPEGGKITEIPVRLLYDNIDLNFMTRYACYRGNRCWCSGDGESAQRFGGENAKYQEVPCPCERQDPFYTGQDRCKILGTLQVLIEGTDRIGGVWKYRTTSWNTVNAILSSLALVKDHQTGASQSMLSRL